MSRKLKTSEWALLSKYTVSLKNTESNPHIRNTLSASGYDDENLAVGKGLLQEAENLQRVCLADREEQAAAYERFMNLRAALHSAFNLHRRLARIAFRRRKLVMEKLAITGIYRTSFNTWITSATKFYKELAADSELLQTLMRFGITEEDIPRGIQMVDEVIAAYTFYINLKGESQKTTQMKRIALEKLSDWMRDFYAVARIAFQDNPQQLESLGIVVKS